MIQDIDRELMAHALRLAERGLNTTAPNPRVGCVIAADNGELIAEGYHQRSGEAHAEIYALAQAGAAAEGATAYVSLEPCSHRGKTGPCVEALITAKVARVVYAMEDPNPQVSGRGIERLRQAGIEVHGPVLEDAAIALNPGFVKRMRRGLPFVRCKMAMSLDGRTAMASGESKWVTGPAARQDVQKWRARSCAIVTGVESVIHDDPSLTVRLGKDDRQPLRVVLDSRGRCPQSAEILDQPGRTILAVGEGVHMPGDREVWHLPLRDDKIDLRALLKRLAQEGCNEVLVETGARLAGAFVAAALVDELLVYIAPKLLGSSARPLFSIEIDKMSGQLPLIVEDLRAVGDDFLLRARPDPEG